MTLSQEELEQTNEEAELAVENDAALQEIEDRANDYEEENVDLFVEIDIDWLVSHFVLSHTVSRVSDPNKTLKIAIFSSLLRKYNENSTF